MTYEEWEKLGINEKIKYVISIMQAFLDGAKIEFWDGRGWNNIDEPSFCVHGYYRVKKTIYKPYEAANHDWLGKKVISLEEGIIRQISGISTCKQFLEIGGKLYTMSDFLDYFTWYDTNKRCGEIK